MIGQGIREPQETLSLWQWLLASIRDRYLCKEDIHVQQEEIWSTMEQGIQCLRELAGLQIIFLEDDRFLKSSDGVQCTSQMSLKFSWLRPDTYSRYLATLQWKEGKDKVGALVMHQCLVCGNKAAEHMQSLEEKIEEGHQKLRNELKEGIYHILPEPRRISSIRTGCLPAKESGYTP